MDWPGHKLTVHVLDDGNKQEYRDMVARVRAACE